MRALLIAVLLAGSTAASAPRSLTVDPAASHRAEAEALVSAWLAADPLAAHPCLCKRAAKENSGPRTKLPRKRTRYA